MVVFGLDREEPRSTQVVGVAGGLSRLGSATSEDVTIHEMNSINQGVVDEMTVLQYNSAHDTSTSILPYG